MAADTHRSQPLLRFTHMLVEATKGQRCAPRRENRRRLCNAVRLMLKDMRKT
jgi:hypothetical protein